jgi:asparagine synthase (glutamine-hydrolysing)
MLRYIIVAGNPNSPCDADTTGDVRRRLEGSAANWRCVHSEPGFYAAYVDTSLPSESPLPLLDRGVIFGSVYPSPDAARSPSPKPLRRLPSKLCEEIIQSRGRVLISGYWGYYIAAIHPSGPHGPVILRSPASSLPCFHARLDTLSIFFSLVDDYAALQLTGLTVNWDAITAQVAGGDYLTHETAINEIEALECGEAMECSPDGCTRHVYWDPRSFLNDRSLGSFADAAHIIRETSDFCIDALASEHRRILVSLSGGLDSSVILSSLARSSHKPSLTAVTYYSRGCGDERFYARSMANMAGCDLVEFPRNDRLDLERFRDCNLTARPVLNFSAPDVEARNVALARESNASAIFDGELGDNIFGSHPSPGVLVECIRRYGLGRRFLEVAVDYAMLTRQSVWKTLLIAIREIRDVAINDSFSVTRDIRQRYGEAAAASALLASAEAVKYHGNLGNRFTHLWLKQSRALAPGSLRLLFGLIAVTSTPHHSPFTAADDPPQISPLVSQPLVEAALRIPGYLHCRSAQDRAVARTAFADVLPAAVLNRGLGKGGPNLWVKHVVVNNTAFLRDFLLDGILVQRKLIDREKLQAVLSPRIVKSTAIVGELIAKLYIEAWLRNPQLRETAYSTPDGRGLQRSSA